MASFNCQVNSSFERLFSAEQSFFIEIKPKVMLQLKLLSTLSFLTIAISLSAQEAPSKLIAPDTIAFQLTEHNNLSVPAILNDQDTLQLMLHTAASGLTVITEAVSKLPSLEFADTDTVESWGGRQDSRYSQNNSLRIGQQNMDSITIWENAHSGPGTDGKFGLSFFEGKVLEIDFDRSLLIVHTRLPEHTGFEKAELVRENGFLFLKGKAKVNKAEYENQFLIHTGYGGAILFDDEFAAKHQLGEQLEILSESELKDAYGNVLKTKKAKLPAFDLGFWALSDVPVAFFEGSIGRQKMSVVGGAMLKQFNLIFDLQNYALYLKPNTLIAEGFSEG